jgi:hypothetical protein
MFYVVLSWLDAMIVLFSFPTSCRPQLAGKKFLFFGMGLITTRTIYILAASLDLRLLPSNVGSW